VLPAFYKHRFRNQSQNTKGYAGYSSTERSIEMMGSKSKKNDDLSNTNSIADYGSEKNVLTTDRASHTILEMSVHGNSEAQTNISRKTSDDQHTIMKTVEVHQTFH
jgi:hypothetical protein